MHILRSIHSCLEIKVFLVKADKVRIVTRQDTFNHELEEVEGTGGHAYILWIADAATSDGDTCTIGVFLLMSDLIHNHGVEDLFSSVLRDIFKSNDEGGVRSLHVLVPGCL